MENNNYEISHCTTWLFVRCTLEKKILPALEKKEYDLETASYAANKAVHEGESNPDISDEEMNKLYDAHEALIEQLHNVGYQIEATKNAIEYGFKFLDNLEFLQDEGILPKE